MITKIELNNNDTLWDKIVRSFKDFDVYYLSEYVKAFQIHGDGIPVLFSYEDDSIRAINVVMKRDIAYDPHFEGLIPENKYFDLVTPYGYGGWLIEGNGSIENLKESYIELCCQEGFISEFVRFHPVLKNSSNLSSLYNILNLGKTVSIDLESPDQVWNGLISKNRNMVRKAQKLGIEIYNGRSPELIYKFNELYNATMDKDNARDYYYFGEDFYKSILYDLKYNSLVFYAVFEGKIIAASIIMFANNQLHYHLSASDKEYLYTAPTNLLLYEAACWGSVNGYKTFHLGGGLGSKEDSLYKFKKAFNRNSDNTFSIGRLIFDEGKYNELLSMRNDVSKDTGFFPAYRA